MRISNITYQAKREIKHIYYELSMDRDYLRNEGKRFVFCVYYFLHDNIPVGSMPIIWKDYIGFNITFAWIIKFIVHK